MKITIINTEKNERRYSREELDELVAQLADGAFLHQNTHDFSKEVCFAAEWVRQKGEVKAKSLNRLVLLSNENLRDLLTVREYKELAVRQLYTLHLLLTVVYSGGQPGTDTQRQLQGRLRLAAVLQSR